MTRASFRHWRRLMKIRSPPYAGNQPEYGSFPSARLINGQAVERRTSRATSNIGSDSHFEDTDIREFDTVFFDLCCRVRWTEIPLLAHDLS